MFFSNVADVPQMKNLFTAIPVYSDLKYDLRYACTRVYTDTHTRAHTPARARVHRQTDARTHTHTRMRTHTHART